MALASFSMFCGSSERGEARSNNFTFIHLLGALLVILGHMFYIAGSTPITFCDNGVQTIGCKMIFVLSGYLVTKSWLSDPHPGRFFTKRVLKIFPSLIAVVLLSVFVLGPIMTNLTMGEYFSNSNTWNYLFNIILSPRYNLPGVFAQVPYVNVVNGSLWTIPVEILCYLLVPLFYLINRKHHYVNGVVFIFFAIIVILRPYVLNNPIIFYGTNLLDVCELGVYFMLGNIFALVDKKNIYNLQLSIIILLVLAFIPIPYQVKNFLLIPVLTYFVLSFGNTPNALFQNVLKKYNVNYGLYLYGFPIQQIVIQLLGKYNLHVLLLFLISLVPIVLFGFLNFIAIEKPISKLQKKLLKKLFPIKPQEN